MNIAKLLANPLYMTTKTVDAKPAALTIDEVEVRKINEADRVVLIFHGEERDLKLTARQAASLARAFGEETDEWKGKTVEVSKGEENGVNVKPIYPENA